jgi:hypothetical protein
VTKLKHRIGDAMGQLHVEASGTDAVVIRANLYYLNDNHYRSCGIPHKRIEATGDIRGWFMQKL